MLTDTQRAAITDDLLDYRECRLGRDAFEVDAERAYLESLDDKELVRFWADLVGQEITHEALHGEDSDLCEAWDEYTAAIIGPREPPAIWQFERLLNEEETHYSFPTLGNAIVEAVEHAPSVSFAHGKLDVLLQVFDMTVDDDGYIVDADTGAFREPYSFDAHGDRQFKPFRETAHDTEDDPLDERLAELRDERDEPHKHHADRVHIDDFGGIIHSAFCPGDEPQVLRDNWFEMLELAGAGALTTNLKGIDESTAVLTTTGIHKAYTDDAGAVFERSES
jgi:hypothetical protein